MKSFYLLLITALFFSASACIHSSRSGDDHTDSTASKERLAAVIAGIEDSIQATDNNPGLHIRSNDYSQGETSGTVYVYTKNDRVVKLENEATEGKQQLNDAIYFDREGHIRYAYHFTYLKSCPPDNQPCATEAKNYYQNGRLIYAGKREKRLKAGEEPDLSGIAFTINTVDKDSLLQADNALAAYLEKVMGRQ